MRGVSSDTFCWALCRLRRSSLQTRWLLQAELAARADLFQPVEHRARQKVFEMVFSDG